MQSTGAADGYRQNKPVLIRARVAESSTVYEVVGRMEVVGGIFTRTLVRPIRRVTQALFGVSFLPSIQLTLFSESQAQKVCTLTQDS